MRIRFLLVLALAALVLPAAAQAKGASEATVTGPGLDKPLYFGGGEMEGTPVMNLTMNAGFFPAVFDQTPSPMRKSAPKRELGAKYAIHWVVPQPDGTNAAIEQDLYPYASPTPVTYMAPGQPIFEQKTRGGWYVASAELKRLLVKAGLPAQSSEASKSSSGRSHIGIAVAAGAAAAAALGFVLMRRRRD